MQKVPNCTDRNICTLNSTSVISLRNCCTWYVYTSCPLHLFNSVSANLAEELVYLHVPYTFLTLSLLISLKNCYTWYIYTSCPLHLFNSVFANLAEELVYLHVPYTFLTLSLLFSPLQAPSYRLWRRPVQNRRPNTSADCTPF